MIVKPTATTNAPAGAVIAAVGWRAGQKVDTDASGNNVTGCTLNGSATPCQQAPQNGLYKSQHGGAGQLHPPRAGTGGATGLPPTIDPGPDRARPSPTAPGQNSDAVYAIVQDAQKFNGCPDVLDRPRRLGLQRDRQRRGDRDRARRHVRLL